MIDVKELRIGNYVMLEKVNYDFKETIFKLNNVGQFRCTFSRISDNAFITKRTNLLKPIPLTEKWLVKFGFVPVGGSSDVTYWRKGNLQLSKDEGTQLFKPLLNRLHGVKGDCCYVFSPDHNGSNVCIESVNQLQNLHFALTKEELIIK